MDLMKRAKNLRKGVRLFVAIGLAALLTQCGAAEEKRLSALEPLPYSENALEPHISAETMSLHYGKHHAGYVKKAVNWALRNIGKRNLNLNNAALKAAREIRLIDSKAARWIASNAIRELESDSVQRRLRK